MSKELKALEVLGYIGGYIIPTNNGNQHLKDFCDIEFAILKQALTELKQIKEANPSEAMESLERIDKEYSTIKNEDFKICFNTIKQTLLKAQKQEKILSVIFKKRIDLESFYSTFVKDDLDYKYYEKYYGTYGLEKLTQEEFDLLKKQLNYENE